MLIKYIQNPDHVLNFEPVNLDPTLSYKEESFQILDRKTSILGKLIVNYMLEFKYLFAYN